MKKTITLFIIAIFVFSMMPMAFAKEGDDIITKKIQRTKEEVKEGEVKREYREKIISKFDACIEKNTNKYPNAKKERIKSICKDTKKLDTRKEIRTKYISKETQNEHSDSKLRTDDKLIEKNPKVKTIIDTLSDDEKKKFISLSRAQKEKVITKGKTELTRYKIKKVTEIKFNERVVTKEKIKKTEEKYKQSKEKYDKSKAEYSKAKARFTQALKNKNETEAIEHAKKFLMHASDMVIENLEKIKSKAEGNDDLTEEELKEIISDIDIKIQEMETAKTNIENATTKEEVKEEGRAIIKSWNNMKNKIRGHSGKVIESRVGEIIKRSESLARKLDRVLEKLESEGINVSSLDTMIDEFSLKIENSKTLFTDAKDLFKKAKDLMRDDTSNKDDRAMIKELTDKGHAKLKEAHNELKEAHKLIVKIAKEARALGGNFEDDSHENEYEVEEESEIDINDDLSSEGADSDDIGDDETTDDNNQTDETETETEDNESEDVDEDMSKDETTDDTTTDEIDDDETEDVDEDNDNETSDDNNEDETSDENSANKTTDV